ncbi:MAG TPA: hypothetical protein VGD23_05055, partial [Sphingomicrobium sp.]
MPGGTRKARTIVSRRLGLAGARGHGRREQSLERALQLVTEAMDLLDAHGSDPQAAAYLAMAQQQL